MNHKEGALGEKLDDRLWALNYTQWEKTFDEAYAQIKKHSSSKSNHKAGQDKD